MALLSVKVCSHLNRLHASGMDLHVCSERQPLCTLLYERLEPNGYRSHSLKLALQMADFVRSLRPRHGLSGSDMGLRVFAQSSNLCAYYNMSA